MNRLKWLAALPSVGGLTMQSKGMLIVALDRWEHSVDTLASMSSEELTEVIEFALVCDKQNAAEIAHAAKKLLKELLSTMATPPSEDELKRFVRDRQIQMQPRDGMLGIYEALTSDDVTLLSFTMDPLTGTTFNPVWLQLALEMLYRLPPVK